MSTKPGPALREAQEKINGMESEAEYLRKRNQELQRQINADNDIKRQKRSAVEELERALRGIGPTLERCQNLGLAININTAIDQHGKLVALCIVADRILP